MPKTRTDIHRPVELITEDYQYAGGLDYGARDGRAAKLNAETIQRVITTPNRKWSGVHPSGQCDHCGAHIRYAALLVHKPTNTVIKVGETCLDNRFDLATADFQRMRKQAELDRAGQRIKASKVAYIEANPDLAWLLGGTTPDVVKNNNFVADVARKFNYYGSLSDAQANVIRNSIKRATEYAAQKAVDVIAHPATNVIAGDRIQIAGEVLSTKYQYGRFGEQLKMLVRDARGFKLWGTVPAAITPKRGDHVRFVANVEASKDDPTFGFYARPTMAQLIAV